MVRIKNRYLLVEILQPTAITPRSHPIFSTNPLSAPIPDDAPPPSIQIHAPLPSQITSRVVLQNFRDAITLWYGDYGTGLVSSSLAIKYFSPATGTLILRCPRAAFRIAWAACTLTCELGENKEGKGSGKRWGVPVVLRVLRVSGTIRKCEEEIISRAKEQVRRFKVLEEKRMRALAGGVRRLVSEEVGEEEGTGGDEDLSEDVGVLVDPMESMDPDHGMDHASDQEKVADADAVADNSLSYFEDG